MNWIALRMLTGDRTKYLGLVFGVTFATLLMTQQVSIFMGILTRTGNQILEVRDADIWVMDNRVRYVDEAPGLQDIDLMRVRGVPGVAWGVRSFKGIVRVRLEDGETRNVRLTGLDDETLVAAPQKMIVGSLDDLHRPDAVVIDKAGYEYMWGQEPYRIGRTFELNDRRAVLVGVCKVAPTFFSDPILYTALQPGRPLCAAGAQPHELHPGQVQRRSGSGGIVPPHRGADWPDGPDPRRSSSGRLWDIFSPPQASP